MKQHCNCGRIALYELRVQWRDFIFFFLISCLLLSTMISIFSLARQIPAEMTEYIQMTGQGSVYVEGVQTARCFNLEQMPVKLLSYDFPYLDSKAIGLPDKLELTEEVEPGVVVSLFSNGAVVHWLPDEKMKCINELNQQLCSGRSVEQADNISQVIWLSDQAAALLQVQSGDTISFCADSAVAKSVSCQVAGIYKQNINLYSYYVTLPLYKASIDTVENVSILLAPLNLKDYQNIISDLKDLGWKPIYSETFMNSVMMLIYALYVICLFLCILEICITCSISRSYFHKRNRFFAICKSLGMQNQSILWIVCLVMQGLMTIAFFVAMLLAPVLSGYIVAFLQELFTDVKVSTNVWTPVSFFLLLAASALLWGTCICSQTAYRSSDIIALMRKENE